MKKIVQIMMMSIFFSVIGVGGFVRADDTADLNTVDIRVERIQGGVPLGTPSISGTDQKGYAGTILGLLFDTTGRIKTVFIRAFQDIYNGNHNTVVRWTGTGFAAGTIRDNGTNIGIGTGVLTNRRINVAGDINFSGDLYRNGTLFTPTLPTDIVRTTGDQTIGGIKTFTGNLMVKSRSIYLGDTQNIYGDNDSAFIYKSNNSNTTQIYLRDENNINYGRVYGSGTGSSFGLLDGDGNWTYYAMKDRFTQFRINNTTIMTLSGSNVGIGTINPNYKLDVNGTITSREANALRMRQSLYSVIHRNDNSNYWILLTDSGSTDGGYNGLRPLKINLANGDVNLDGNTFALDATNNYIGIGVARPTDELDVNGKIRMRVQTQATDTPDTVATKKYVDDKMVREEDRLTGYREVPINLDEDEYGATITSSWVGGAGYSRDRWNADSDTCNSNKNTMYSCPANVSKTCRDLYLTTVERRGGDGDINYDTVYNSRPIICIKSWHLIRTEEGTEGIKVSNSGTARIISRDYSGWREHCGVSINIPAADGKPSCVESHSFRLASGFGGGGSDGSCEAALEAAIKSEGICTNFKGVKSVNWNRTGDSGGVRIEYFGF